MQANPASAVNILEHVRSHSPRLSASALRVANVVLEEPGAVVNMSAQSLAEASRTSVGTVMRFCQSVGQSGYHSFRLSLAAAIAPVQTEADPRRSSREREPSRRMFCLITEQLDASAEALNFDTVATVAKHLLDARRILILSTGPSQPIAMTLGYALNSQGQQVSYPMDHETQAVIASQLGPDDVCFVVSHSGESLPVLSSAMIADARGATLLALTSFHTSTLATHAEHALVAGAPQDAHRSADAASRPVHLAVIHSLLVALDEARASTLAGASVP